MLREPNIFPPPLIGPRGASAIPPSGLQSHFTPLFIQRFHVMHFFENSIFIIGLLVFIGCPVCVRQKSFAQNAFQRFVPVQISPSSALRNLRHSLPGIPYHPRASTPAAGLRFPRARGAVSGSEPGLLFQERGGGGGRGRFPDPVGGGLLCPFSRPMCHPRTLSGVANLSEGGGR